MSITKLGNIMTFINGKAYNAKNWKKLGYPIIRIQNLNNCDSEFNYFQGDLNKQVVVDSGDLLFSWSGSIGTSFGPHIWERERGVLNQHIFKIKFDDEKACKKYLFYGLLELTKEIENSAHGGVGLVHIKKSDLINFEIQFPQLKKQKNITSILEKADNLRKKCQKVEKALNILSQSIFIEVFGDPIVNDKNWNIITINEVCHKITDGTHKTPIYVESGVKFLSAKNISKKIIDWNNTKFITEIEHKNLIKRCNPEIGDILLAKSGTIGVAALVDQDIEFSLFESAALLKYKRDIISGSFLLHYLNCESIKEIYNKKTKGNTIKHLHLTDIRSLPLIVPPLNVQKEFEERIKKVDKLIFLNNQRMRKVDYLFNALLKNCFKGNLEPFSLSKEKDNV